MKGGQWVQAHEAFTKAIQDSDNLIFPEAYVGRSLAYLKLYQRLLALDDAFTAIEQDNRLIRAIDHIRDNFSNSRTRSIYQTRLKYLAIDLGLAVNRQLKLPETDDAYAFVQESQPNNISYLIFLLIQDSVPLPTSIEKEERLRVAYLVAFLHELPHYTFYILDQLLDGSFPLSDMDCFFYLASAYQVGEPVSELMYYDTLTVPDGNSAFGKAFLTLSAAIKDAIASNQYLDPYLLDIPEAVFSISKEAALELKGRHEWVAQALEGLANGRDNYKMPFLPHEFEGLTYRFLEEIKETHLTDEIRNKDSWDNFMIHLKSWEKQSENQPKFKVQITNIKNCIDDKIPYELLLTALFQTYNGARDERVKHNIAVLQAAVIIFAKGRSAILKGISTDGGQAVIGTLTDMGGKTALGFFFSFAIVQDFGISTAISLITNIAIKRITEAELNRLKEELEKELYDI